MRKSRPNLRLAALALGMVGVLVVAATVVFVSWLPRFGAGFDPSAPAGLAQLEHAAENGRALARALSGSRTRHGRLPEDLVRLADEIDFDPHFRASDSGAWMPSLRENDTEVWHYLSEEPTTCAIWRKLGFDSSIEGRHATDGTWTWWYEPGDGSRATRLPW